MKKKVAIIGTNGLPAQYGGFETLANYLTSHLKEDFEFTVYCNKRNTRNKLKTFNNARLLYIPLSANGLQSILYDILSILHAWFASDILLILGGSGAPIFPLCKLFNKKIVLNIGGVDWKRDKWNFFTQKYIQFSEWLSVKYSDIVITDNLVIKDYYDKKYNCKSILIPYGGNHVIKSQFLNGHLKKYPFLKERYSVSVSRAQEDNMIHIVLEAYKNLPKYKLVIISNWQNSKYGIDLKKRYGNTSNIHMIDAVYDQKELDLLRSNAYLYIHSHSFCGTAPSLVEEMNLNLPIICYDANTNRSSVENKTPFFKNSESLMEEIQRLDNNKLESLKNEMIELAARRYTWEVVTTEYKKCLNLIK